MPHYADGSPAQVGDLVKGKTYNQPGEVVGMVVKITQLSESCNCEVLAFCRIFCDPESGRTFPVPASDKDYGETRAFTKL